MQNPTDRALLRQTLLIRRVEEEIVRRYPSDKIQSPVHLSIGQEAASVGVCSALQLSDVIFGNYRGHALYLAKGGSLNAMIAELYGKKTGCAGGKGGSMHLCAPEVGLMGASAVVASTIPHAVGYALSQKRRQTGVLTTVMFGDGALEEGVFHESMNLAALRNAPVLFVCENNGLAVHNDQVNRQSFKVQKLVTAYDVPYFHAENGQDPFAVRTITMEAANLARTNGPAFLEIDTFRAMEHVGPGEDWEAGYRLVGEREEWMRSDPLFTSKSLVQELEPDILKEIETAFAFAEASPYPDDEDLLLDVV